MAIVDRFRFIWEKNLAEIIIDYTRNTEILRKQLGADERERVHTECVDSG